MNVISNRPDNVAAIPDKHSQRNALRSEAHFAERAARADTPRAFDLLKRAGAGAEPVKGDELID
jgi:hypothetical protein